MSESKMVKRVASPASGEWRPGEYVEPFPAPPGAEEWRAAVAQMLAWEKEGGDGWWRGWEMLKAAYAAPAPPAQGELEAALQACHNWLRKNANAESKLCREQLNRRTDKLDAFVEAHNAIAQIIREAGLKDA